jgi:hypothetical protein
MGLLDGLLLRRRLRQPRGEVAQRIGRVAVLVLNRVPRGLLAGIYEVPEAPNQHPHLSALGGNPPRLRLTRAGLLDLAQDRTDNSLW